MSILKKKSVHRRPKKGYTPSYRGGNLASNATQLKKALGDNRTIIQSAIQASVFQGPLPPPDALRAYEDIVPGGAERILAMAERQQKHDHMMDIKEYNYRKIGLYGGISLFILAMIVGIYLVYLGAPWVATALFAPLTVISIMSVIGGHDKIASVSRHMRNNTSEHPNTTKKQKA